MSSREAIENLERELRGRVDSLRSFNRYLISVAVAIFCTCLISAFLLAEFITSTEVSSIDKKLSSLIDTQTTLVASMSPEMTRVHFNIDRFNRAVTNLGLSEVPEGCYLKDKKKYITYGKVKLSYFSDPKKLKSFISETLKNLVAKKSSDHSDVIAFTVDWSEPTHAGKPSKSLCPDSANQVGSEAEEEAGASAHYFWAIKEHDIDQLANSVDKLEMEPVSATLDDDLERRNENSNSISELFKLRREILAGEGSPKPEGKAEGKVEDRSSVTAFSYLLQLNLNKLGIISIGIFTISVIVSIYRYNRQLAAFYLSRAQAMQAKKSPLDLDFATLATILSPAIDFDKNISLGLVSGKPESEAGKENKDKD